MNGEDFSKQEEDRAELQREYAKAEQLIDLALPVMDQRRTEVRELGRTTASFIRGLRDEEIKIEDRRDAIQFFVLVAAGRLYDQWKVEDEDD